MQNDKDCLLSANTLNTVTDSKKESDGLKKLCNIIFMSDVDCQNCWMVKQGKFIKQTKCCSFLPFQPNFKAHIGSAFVSSRYIKTRLGLVPSADYVKSFLDSEYGQNSQLKCDFFLQGQCSIWSDRPSVCRTYFCTNSSSMSFGQTKFQVLENSMAQAVLFEMGYTLKEVEQEIEFYNKLIDGDQSVCYPFDVDFKFYQQCADFFESIKDWQGWLGKEYYDYKAQWEIL